MAEAARAVEVRLREMPNDSIDVDLSASMADVTRLLERLLETVGDHPSD